MISWLVKAMIYNYYFTVDSGKNMYSITATATILEFHRKNHTYISRLCKLRNIFVRRRKYGRKRTIDSRGERRLWHIVSSNRKNTLQNDITVQSIKTFCHALIEAIFYKEPSYHICVITVSQDEFEAEI